MKLHTVAPNAGKNPGYISKTAYTFNGLNYQADVQDGDTLTIVNAGKIESGQFGEQVYFNVETRNGVKKAPFNQPTINALITAWGNETKDWAGRQIKARLAKTVIDGKEVTPAFFNPA